MKKHDLYNYLYRKSKNSEYFSFVLEGVKAVPKSKYKTIHLGFTNINTFNEWFEEVKAAVDFARAKMWAQDLGVQIANETGSGLKGEKKPEDDSKPMSAGLIPAAGKEEVPKPVTESSQKPSQDIKPTQNQTKPVAQATTIVSPEKKPEPPKTSSSKDIPADNKQNTSINASNSPSKPELDANVQKKPSNLVNRIIK